MSSPSDVDAAGKCSFEVNLFTRRGMYGLRRGVVVLRRPISDVISGHFWSISAAIASKDQDDGSEVVAPVASQINSMCSSVVTRDVAIDRKPGLEKLMRNEWTGS